ncbi:hypothetical protein [Spirosoma foliorum]|uniref:Uncharacterized protein n=1 Tax=Spirosoma foliorum TaxID=2710596 RepID=A0A7G5H2Q5_9BACT|nr:hypothetical protein [Spirosoma foliorum]QMW05397.1 hypothetical protein H3H32_11140 [Spirosoma foliorum]
MKIFVAEKTDLVKIWAAFLYLPVQIGFLALSFNATILLGDQNKSGSTFGICMIYILFLFVSIIIWKHTPVLFIKREIHIAIGLTIVNLSFTVLMLVNSILMILDFYGHAH